MNQNEYFDETLDQQEAKIDKKLIGSMFYVERVIRRLGYKYEASTISVAEVDAKGNEMLVESLTNGIANYLSTPRDTARLVSEKIIQDMREGCLRIPTYEAIGRLVAEKRRNEGEKAQWRRMWFVNFVSEWPYHQVMRAEIKGIKKAWTGRWYPASGGPSYGPDGVEYDYEPGGLNPAYSQSLYIADLYVAMSSKDGWALDRCSVLVHPGDLLTEIPERKEENKDGW